MEFIITRDSEPELQHHGIKGQKWYKRRYQNKDGSLTPLGERRRSLGERIHDYKVKKTRKKSLEKARATKETNKKTAEEEAKAAEERKKKLESGKIPVKKMTNEELALSLARKQSEQKYKDAVLATSTGKRFVSKMWNDAIVPGMVDGGKKVVGKFVEDKVSELLGIEVKSEYQRLKESAEMAKWRKQQFQDERDYTEARRRYEEHLERDRRNQENSNNNRNQENNNNNRNQENNNNNNRNNNENSNRDNNNRNNNENSNRDREVDNILSEMQNRRASEIEDAVREREVEVDNILSEMQNRRASEIEDAVREREIDG